MKRRREPARPGLGSVWAGDLASERAESPSHTDPDSLRDPCLIFLLQDRRKAPLGFSDQCPSVVRSVRLVTPPPAARRLVACLLLYAHDLRMNQRGSSAKSVFMEFPEEINNGQAACGGYMVEFFEPLMNAMGAGRNGSGRCPLTRAEILRTRGGNRLAGSALCVVVRLCKLACEIARPHRPGVASRSAPLLLFWQYRRKAPLGFSDQCL